MKYSDYICEYLYRMNYTHCFFVGGGNIMHLIGSASEKFRMIPVVNEVAAGIACEYFNESHKKEKSFALVTAGPGLTNIITAIAGAFFESRELLVLGGQVKTEDLCTGKERQKGIQEINGIKLVESISKLSIRIENPVNDDILHEYCKKSYEPRKGPVFLEFPIDVQAKNIDFKYSDKNTLTAKYQFPNKISNNILSEVEKYLKQSARPIVLIGGGIERFHKSLDDIKENLSKLKVPLMTSWNGIDKIDYNNPLFFGRPDTWGQRYANILIQQCDLLIAVGAKLGLQQTGFNWQKFIPNGKIIHVDCDEAELNKKTLNIDLKLNFEANDFLEKILQINYTCKQEWLDYCREVKKLLPLNDSHNTNKSNYISPYKFSEILSTLSISEDIIIPCSSGGASTVLMQSFMQKKGQIIINNKSLASMGYGLSGAIGASIANPKKRTILIEGDGGFAQNLQEIATAVANNLNLKIFIFENSGYASIRMTQKNYFNGKYIGCDTNTGLGFPNWFKLFDAYGVETFEISDENFVNNQKFIKLFNNQKCAAFIVRIDPEQTYFPKISSKIKADGSMESNPLHLMSPELEPELAIKVFKYINYEKQS